MEMERTIEQQIEEREKLKGGLKGPSEGEGWEGGGVERQTVSQREGGRERDWLID